jgi:hypothetical protein
MLNRKETVQVSDTTTLIIGQMSAIKKIKSKKLIPENQASSNQKSEIP